MEMACHTSAPEAGESAVENVVPRAAVLPSRSLSGNVNMETSEAIDLLILVDATASMSRFLASLRQSLPQIISISALTNCFQRIGLLAYRDYCDKDLLEWSGWMNVELMENDAEQPDLVDIAGRLVASGGGDYPEATKTGLAKAYEVMRSDAKTLLLLYTDAPPHARLEEYAGNKNDLSEQEALLRKESYGGTGHLFADWVSAASTLRSGKKMAQVMCLLDRGYRREDHYYQFLSTATDGACLQLRGSEPREISETTIEMLMAWMGVRKEGAGEVNLPAEFTHYQDGAIGMTGLQSELDPGATEHLRPQRFKAMVDVLRVPLTRKNLEALLPKKATPLQDLATTYKQSERYRALVTTHLRRIIERDVTSISLNPVFGSLWRTFCNHRENDSRQDMLNLFGLKVDALRDANERAKLKTWLEESYDYTAEVMETIETVQEAERFPCVCLDPTLTFTMERDGDEEGDEEHKPITTFRRDELLEIGRSCDWRILRRLGRVLTRLTFIESAETMPAHLSGSDVTKIPMALADKRYGRRFWKILLHIVVPGTMLGGRSGALLAALAIRLGIQPLVQAAETEMLLWRDRWNNIEIPETWNTSCLSLLLDADEAYLRRHVKGILLDKDRDLFKRLVEYKMLEMNLKTTLHAKVGWRPDKSLIRGGKTILCKSCEYPRSVTVMGSEGICGPCWCNKNDEEEPYDIHIGMGKNVDGIPRSYWYECSVRECRAQYVVYNVDGLNVRPKCHYCREGQRAPVVECIKCCSRTIWPEEYRSEEDSDHFTCSGCQDGKETIVELEVTADALREENGQDWLLQNEDQKLKQPFNGRSLYNAASTSVPLDDFCDRVRILPARDAKDVRLRYQGKPLHNSLALVEELYSWIFRRRTESATCSLCFGNLRKDASLPACGRSGCQQRVCKACLGGWYGLNRAGRIINTAALHCPFCRRAPTAKTLSRCGRGVHAIGGLADAVARSGEWIYAWCHCCGYAKEYIERVCAAGAPEEVQNFTCQECRVSEGRMRKTRHCPGCGIETEKIGGCDHVQCTQCSVHWCFFCGERQHEKDIYAHMREEHGGYYGGLEYDDGYDEEEEDYGDD
ncbi:ariadne-like RING finger [Lecanosticta acicola]|uniref:Ariadne-like RING finger n=1 Tax=Lecanosticta acicola TaxID=111012 RepID=A0AAI9EC61_9PEZI|nr:ariadne-like RING finger [Lecanosticta acicola]